MVALFVCLFLAGSATSAWGHIDLDPRQSVAKRWETYTVRIPNETTSPTIKVRLVVPKAFEIEMVKHSEVWKIESTRDERGFIRELTWSGGHIPPQTFGEVKFLARNPGEPGLYRWDVTQVYETGEPAPWETQTRIVPVGEVMGGQQAEEAWRAAQAATTMSFIAVGVSLMLILVTVLGVVRTTPRPKAQQPSQDR